MKLEAALEHGKNIGFEKGFDRLSLTEFSSAWSDSVLGRPTYSLPTFNVSNYASPLSDC
jgi:hypothetical protein